MMKQARRWAIVMVLTCLAASASAADPGLVTVASKHSVAITVQRFEAAIKAKSDQGWMVFTELDHAAAAEKSGQKLLPRTVIVFGNPRVGTANMVNAPTLAIDLPPKALVWQDDAGKVWLTYNSAQYLMNSIYPRHAVAAAPGAPEAFALFLKDVADRATQ